MARARILLTCVVLVVSVVVVPVAFAGGVSAAPRSPSAHTSCESIVCITTTGFSGATVFQPFSQTLVAMGGAPPYTWSVAPATPLPPGLTLSPDGLLSGTPTTTGNYEFAVDVTDSMGHSAVSPLLPLPVVGTTGYWMAGSDGGAFAFGSAPFDGSAVAGVHAPIVGIANAGASGYWLAAANGTVYSYRAPVFPGSQSGLRLNAPIVGIEPTIDGGGYYLVSADGGVFAFGDAAFYGSLGDVHLNAPIVGMAVSGATGPGYYLVGADGGVFAFGHAAFEGSMGGQPLNEPVVGIEVDLASPGYWLVARDGGIFAFDAPFLGSMGGTRLNSPVVGMAATNDAFGYYLVGSDGGVFCFGTATFFGSLGGRPLAKPIVGIASSGSGSTP